MWEKLVPKLGELVLSIVGWATASAEEKARKREEAIKKFNACGDVIDNSDERLDNNTRNALEFLHSGTTPAPGTVGAPSSTVVDESRPVVSTEEEPTEPGKK